MATVPGKPTHLIAYEDTDTDSWAVDVYFSYAEAERGAIIFIENGLATEVMICEIKAEATLLPPQRPTAIVTKVKN